MITKIKNIGSLISWDTNKNKISINSSSDLEILIQDGLILDIGQSLNDFDIEETINAYGGLITPGFIDCHTHPIFSGNRSHDFKLRTEGKTYQEISKSGGGINSTVNSVRNSSKEQLFNESLNRINLFLKNGTTTIEAKSGYGLTLKDEIKSLEIIKMLNKHSPIDIIPTFMGAHDFPVEYLDSKDKYVDLICNEMIPEVAEKKLAIFCDVFCENGYFTISQSEKILLTGLEYGLIPRLHADEFIDSGAAKLAADIKASSADHLMYASDENLQKMAAQGVVSVLLPGTTFFLGKNKYVNAKRIIDAGGEIAIASDYNPGSCNIQSMPLIILLSC